MFRSDIQGLRGISIIFVILYHLNNKILYNGYIGVDIFLIISGYFTLTSIKKSKLQFSYITKRIKRLIPSSYTVLLTVLLFLKYINGYEILNIINDIKDCIYQIVNISFYRKSLDYYSSDYKSILLHF